MAEQVRAELEPYFDHAEHDPVVVRAQDLSAADFLGSPRRVTLTGGYVVVSDMLAEHVIHVFDRTSHEHLGSFGRRGQGPGEFFSGAVVAAVPGADGIIAALDPTTRRVTRFRLPGGEIVPFAGRDIVQLPVLFLYALELVDEARAIGLGFFEQGRLGLFDLAAGTMRFTGPVPGDEADESYVRRQQAYHARLALNPARTRAVVATRLSTDVVIYDAAGELVARAQTPYRFPVDYMVDGDGNFMPGLRNRFGYQSVTATDSLVYALFSGKAEAHYRGMSGAHAEFVHVFGWNGTLVRVLRLEREVLAIAVDEAASALYAVTEQPEPAVLVFPLVRSAAAPAAHDAAGPADR